jgi:hypothetical protein
LTTELHQISHPMLRCIANNWSDSSGQDIDFHAALAAIQIADNWSEMSEHELDSPVFKFANLSSDGSNNVIQGPSTAVLLGEDWNEEV